MKTSEELPDKLYYTISEVSKYMDVAPSLLRYWESEFNTIKPRRNKKGTRFYTKSDIEQIKLIHLLVKEQGYTLAGAKDKLKADKFKTKKKVELKEGLEDLKDFLTQIRDVL
jgi:DNA-binding transcriptional MerR regulator